MKVFLTKQYNPCAKPAIIFMRRRSLQKQGWTSFELAEHMLHTKLNEQYDFVTLLIGVNNQYRELPAKNLKLI
jgi:hypothetical protein